MVTSQELTDALDLRDNGIRKEFRNVYNALEDLKGRMNERFEEVGQRFEEVGQRFEDFEGRMNERFGDAFRVITAQSTNSRAIKWKDPIHPVGVLEISPESPPRYRWPLHARFPKKIIEFWSLQSPKRHSRLTYLCAFYGVSSGTIVNDLPPDDILQYTSDSDEDLEPPYKSSSSSSSSSPAIPLQDAVTAHPQRALSCLATALHLDYDSISHTMEMADHIRRLRAQRETQGVKRTQISEDDPNTMPATRKARKARSLSKEQEAQIKSFVPPKVVPGMTLSDLVRDVQEYQEPSPQSYVRWASASLPDRPRVRDMSEPLLHIKDPQKSTSFTSDRQSKMEKPDSGPSSQKSRVSTIPLS